jgi:anti-sigma B factor antagonist
LPIDDLTRELFDQIYTLVDDMGRTRIVLNLSAVNFISSLCLGKLVMLNRKCLAAGGRLGLCCLTPHVGEILEITRLKDVLETYNQEGDAVASLQGSSSS